NPVRRGRHSRGRHTAGLGRQSRENSRSAGLGLGRGYASKPPTAPCALRLGVTWQRSKSRSPNQNLYQQKEPRLSGGAELGGPRPLGVAAGEGERRPGLLNER